MRNGTGQRFSSSKFKRFLTKLIQKTPPLEEIDIKLVMNKITMGNDMSTVSLAEHIAEICASLTVQNYQYALLGGRVLISLLHRKSPSSFTECMAMLEDTLSVDFLKCLS